MICAFHLLQILGDKVPRAVRPRPGMGIMVQHPGHDVLFAAVLTPERSTPDVVVVGHAESERKGRKYETLFNFCGNARRVDIEMIAVVKENNRSLNDHHQTAISCVHV